MSRAICLAVAAALIGGCGEVSVEPLELDPSGIRAAVVAHERERFSTTLPNPCTGEQVRFEGNGHFLITSTVDGAGGFHVKLHFNAQGVRGIGLESGDRYQLVDVAILSFNVAGPFPAEQTEASTFLVISRGADKDFRVHTTTHFAVNANGDVTALVRRIVASECAIGGDGPSGESGGDRGERP